MLKSFPVVKRLAGSKTLSTTMLAALLSVSLTAAGQSSRQMDWLQFADKYRSHSLQQNDPEQRNRQTPGFEPLVSEATAFYRSNPHDQVAFDAMLFVLAHDTQHKSYEELCRYLRSYQLGNPNLSLALSMHYPLTVVSYECERLFKSAATSGASDKVRDTAKLGLSIIYLDMATFLANTSELNMTPRDYLTSGVRASFQRLPEKTAEHIGRKLRNRSWLSRRWQAVRNTALELVGEVQGSPHELERYQYAAEGFHREPAGTIGESAATIQFQLERASPGARIMDFGASDIDGNPGSFDAYLGNVILLDIWATWCKSCIKSLPYLQALQQGMEGRPFKLITISIDQQRDDVKRFMNRNAMPFTNWYIGEDREFLSKWPVWPLPRLFVIDQRGVIRSVPRVGPQDLNRYIERLVVAAEQSARR